MTLGKMSLKDLSIIGFIVTLSMTILSIRGLSPMTLSIPTLR
jgi:hypothetical protein